MRELTLEKAIFHRGRFVRKLRMRAPTQADVDEACALADSSRGRGIALLSILCDVDPLLLQKLRPADEGPVQAAFDELSAGLPCFAG